jgi:hypothetical protein
VLQQQLQWQWGKDRLSDCFISRINVMYCGCWKRAKRVDGHYSWSCSCN